MKTVWMVMIEEEDTNIVRELEVQAFDSTNRTWERLNEYTKGKYEQSFIEYVNEPNDPIDFMDPTNYAWTWTNTKHGETVRIHVVRMPLIEGEENGEHKG